MAMFSKDVPEKSDARAATDGGISIIAHGMTITGDVETAGVIKVEGVIEGNVRGARQVLVGRQGEIRGDVHAREVVVGGRVVGHVAAAERVEIQGTSLVNGDVSTKSIIVLEGGRINGTVKMDEGVEGAAAPEE